MTLDSFSDVPSTLKRQQRVERAEGGELRLRIAKIYGDDISNSLIINFDRILIDSAREIASQSGLSYALLCTINRLLMTKFRCPLCGLLPLYFLDIKYLNKIRCGKCSMIVALKNSSGKYGRIRKRLPSGHAKS